MELEKGLQGNATPCDLDDGKVEQEDTLSKSLPFNFLMDVEDTENADVPGHQEE